MLTALRVNGSGQMSEAPNLGILSFFSALGVLQQEERFQWEQWRAGCEVQAPRTLVRHDKKGWSQLGAAQHGAGRKQRQW